MIQKEWRRMNDVTRQLSQVRKELDSLQTRMEEALNLDDEFTKMNRLVGKMTNMTKQLNQMMELNQGLVQIAEELTNTRNTLNTASMKLNGIDTVNLELKSLSQKRNTMENMLEDIMRNSDSLSRSLLHVQKDLASSESICDTKGCFSQI